MSQVRAPPSAHALWDKHCRLWLGFFFFFFLAHFVFFLFCFFYFYFLILLFSVKFFYLILSFSIELMVNYFWYFLSYNKRKQIRSSYITRGHEFDVC